MAPTNKDIVVRVTGQTSDFEKKLDGLTTHVSALKNTFSSLGDGGAPMVAKTQQMLEQLKQLSTATQGFKQSLGSVGSGAGEANKVARAYGELIKNLSAVEKEASHLNKTLAQDTGNPMPVLIQDAITLRQELAKLSKVGKIGIDIETTSRNLDDIKKIGSDGRSVGRARVISMAASGKTPIVIDLDQMSSSDKAEISKLLSSQVVKIAHNLEFEKKWLAASGIKLDGPVYDTLHAARSVYDAIDKQRGGDAHTLNLPNKTQLFELSADGKGFSLDTLVRSLFGRALDKQYQDAHNWTGKLTPEHLRYNAQDSVEAVNVFDKLTPAAAQLGIEKRIDNLIMQAMASATAEAERVSSMPKQSLQNYLLTSESEAQLKMIQAKFGKELSTIGNYLNALDEGDARKIVTNQLAGKGAWDVAINGSGTRGENERLWSFKHSSVNSVEDLVQDLSRLGDSLNKGHLGPATESIAHIYDSLRKMSITMPILEGKNPFGEITEDLRSIAANGANGALAAFTTTLKHLGTVLPAVRKAMETAIKDVFSPDQLSAMINAGKLPGALSPKYNRKVSDMSPEEYDELEQLMKYDSSKTNIKHMDPKSKWFQGYKQSTMPILSDLSSGFAAAFDPDESELRAMLSEGLSKAGIPEVAHKAIADIMQHQANKLHQIGKEKLDPNGTLAAGTVENSVNQIASRMQELDEYISNDTLRLLNYNLKRLEQYKTALQNRIKMAGEGAGSAKIGPVLTSVENQVKLMKEAIAAQVMSAAVKPFSEGDIDLQKQIATAIGTMVSPNLDSARDIISKFASTPRKYTHTLADGSKVGITNVEAAVNARGNQADLEAWRSHSVDDYAGLSALRARLIDRNKQFKLAAGMTEDPKVHQAYKEMMDSVDAEISAMESILKELRQARDASTKLREATDAVRNDKPISTKFDLSKTEVERDLQLLQGMSKIPGINLQPYKENLMRDVKDLRELRERYNNFRSLVTGKAPVYSAPINDAAWKEAGLDTPLQWDKQGVTQNALKALKEYRTRVMQIFHKNLFEGADFRPDQIQELMPIAKTAGLTNLFKTSQGMWDQMKGKSDTSKLDFAREFTPTLRKALEEASDILEQRTDLLKVISGSMTKEQYKDKQWAAQLSKAGAEIAAMKEQAGSFGSMAVAPDAQGLMADLMALMEAKADLAKLAEQASSATGRHTLDQKELKEELYKIEEQLNKTIDEREKDVLNMRKSEILQTMRASNMSLRGFTDDEVSMNLVRDEMRKLKDTSSLNSIAADGVKRILNKEVTAIDQFTNAQLTALDRLLGGREGVTEMMGAAPEKLKEMLTSFDTKAKNANNEISRLDSLTRKNTLAPKGAIEQQLDDRMKQAQRSWNDFVKTVPNGVEDVKKAYADWHKENEQLINEIQALDYKLKVLRSDFKSPGSGSGNGGGNDPKSELAKVNAEIAKAKDEQLKILRGVGKYEGMTPIQKTVAVRKISDEDIRPLEKFKQQLKEANDIDSKFNGSNGHGRGFIGWLNRIAITFGSMMFLSMQLQTIVGGLIVPGMQYNADVERSTIGMASIVQSLSEIDGKQAQWNKSLRVSATIIEEIKNTAMFTGQQSADLIQLTQGLMGSGLTAGMSTKEIVDFSSLGSSALQQIGMPPAQFIQELRDMVQGGIQPQSSVLATIIGISDSDVLRLRTTGKLFDELTQRLSGFKMGINEYVNTLDGKMNVLREAFTRLMAEGFEQANESMKWGMDQILNTFMDWEQSQKERKPIFREEAKQSVRDMVKGMLDLASQAVNTFNAIRKIEALQDLFSLISTALSFAKTHMEEITKILIAWVSYKATSFIFSKLIFVLTDVIKLGSNLPQIFKGSTEALKGVETAAKLTFATAIVGGIADAIKALGALKEAIKAVAAMEIFTILIKKPNQAGKEAKNAPGGGIIDYITAFATMAFVGFRDKVVDIFKSLGTRIMSILNAVWTLFTVTPWGRVAGFVLLALGAVELFTGSISDLLGNFFEWVKKKLQYFGLFKDEEQVDLSKVQPSNKPKPEDYWATLRNKYSTMKAEDIKSMKDKEREYWQERMKASVETFKAELDVAKNQLQRLFDQHQVTIKQYYDKLYEIRRKQIQAEADMLDNQISLIEQRISETKRMGSNSAGTLKGTAGVGAGTALDGFQNNITSGYGARTAPIPGASTNHDGIDIAMDEGTPLSSLKDGVVEMAEFQPGGYGNIVGIRHKDGTLIFYAHMNAIAPEIQVGKSIVAGEYFGVSGNTGNSGGPHLHLGGETADGRSFDPTEYVAAAIAQQEDINEHNKAKLNEDARTTVDRAQAVTGSNTMHAQTQLQLLDMEKELVGLRAQRARLGIQAGDLGNEKAAELNKAMTDYYEQLISFYSDNAKANKFLELGQALPGAKAAMNVNLGDWLDKYTASGQYQNAGVSSSQILEQLLNTSVDGVPEMMQDPVKKMINDVLKNYAKMWKEAADDEGRKQMLLQAIKAGYGVDVISLAMDEMKKELEFQAKGLTQVIAGRNLDYERNLGNFERGIRGKYKYTMGNIKMKDNFTTGPSELGKDYLEFGKKNIVEQFNKDIDDYRTKIDQTVSAALKLDTTLTEVISKKKFRDLDATAQDNVANLLEQRKTLAMQKYNEFKTMIESLRNNPDFKDMTESEQNALINTLYDSIGNEIYAKLIGAMEELYNIAGEAPQLKEKILTMIRELKGATKEITDTKDDNATVSIFGNKFNKKAVSSALTGAFSDFMMQIPAIINGTKSVGAAFRDMAFAIVQAMLQVMIQEFAVHLVKVLLGGVGGASTGGRPSDSVSWPSWSTGGNIPNYDDGGMTLNGRGLWQYQWKGDQTAGGKQKGSGSDTSDNHLVAVSPSEWVIQARAARLYGDKTMDAINQGKIHPGALRGLVSSYANGGIINTMSNNATNNFLPGDKIKTVNAPGSVDKARDLTAPNSAAGSAGGGGFPGINLINVIDPKMVSNYMNSSDGTKTFINLINGNKNTIKKIVNS